MDKNVIIVMTKISIILPTYNGGKYIKRAIESVISQSFKDWELLVIDDGSTDNTKEIVESFDNPKIIYLKNEHNLGIQKTLNRGLKEAKGEYIARIDDDDEWIDSQKLEKQFNFLDSNHGYVLIGTGVIVIDENGKELFRYLLPERDEDIRKKILSKNCFVHSSVMFRKDVTLNIGGYTEKEKLRQKNDYDLCEDYDLWLRLGLVGKLYNLSEYSVNYTSRLNSICSNNKLNQLKKNLILTKEFKNKYPNYLKSFILAYARLVVYGFILKSPIKFSLNKLIKIYKES